MRRKDPELMNRIYDYRNRYILDNNHAPTQREIAEAMNISPARARNYLTAMVENGMISYNGNEEGTDRSEKSSSDQVSMPAIGSAKYGGPGFWTDNDVEEYVSLPTSIFGTGELYLVRVHGTGLADAGIQNGDLVVIREQDTAEIGNIVVALDDNNKKTLMIYGGTDPDTGKAVLLYQNEAEYPNKRILVDKLVIGGVATNVIHTYDTCKKGCEK